MKAKSIKRIVGILGVLLLLSVSSCATSSGAYRTSKTYNSALGKFKYYFAIQLDEETGEFSTASTFSMTAGSSETNVYSGTYKIEGNIIEFTAVAKMTQSEALYQIAKKESVVLMPPVIEKYEIGTFDEEIIQLISRVSLENADEYLLETGSYRYKTN